MSQQEEKRLFVQCQIWRRRWLNRVDRSPGTFGHFEVACADRPSHRITGVQLTPRMEVNCSIGSVPTKRIDTERSEVALPCERFSRIRCASFERGELARSELCR